MSEEYYCRKRESQSLKKQSALIRQLRRERRKLTPEELEAAKVEIKELMKNRPNKGAKSEPSYPSDEILNSHYGL